MAAGVVRQRITGMRILVIRLLADSYSGKLPAHVQQSLDPIGLRRCRTRPRGGGVGKGVLAVRRRTRDSTHRCVELHQQGLPPSVLQGLPRYGEPDAEVMGWLYDPLDKPWKNELRRLAFDKLNTR